MDEGSGRGRERGQACERAGGRIGVRESSGEDGRSSGKRERESMRRAIRSREETSERACGWSREGTREEAERRGRTLRSAVATRSRGSPHRRGRSRSRSGERQTGIESPVRSRSRTSAGRSASPNAEGECARVAGEQEERGSRRGEMTRNQSEDGRCDARESGVTRKRVEASAAMDEGVACNADSHAEGTGTKARRIGSSKLDEGCEPAATACGDEAFSQIGARLPKSG
eukprot:3317624-Pleurochrysis_carterae.AAC.1